MKLTAERVERIAEENGGRITAANDQGTCFRVEFPVSTRAAGFYDDMVTRLRDDKGVEFTDPARCVVLVTLTEEG